MSPALRQVLDTEDELREMGSDAAVPSEVRDWLAATFTQQARAKGRRAEEKPKFRSIVHAVQAGIFVERSGDTGDTGGHGDGDRRRGDRDTEVTPGMGTGIAREGTGTPRGYGDRNSPRRGQGHQRDAGTGIARGGHRGDTVGTELREGA